MTNLQKLLKLLNIAFNNGFKHSIRFTHDGDVKLSKNGYYLEYYVGEHLLLNINDLLFNDFKSDINNISFLTALFKNSIHTFPFYQIEITNKEVVMEYADIIQVLKVRLVLEKPEDRLSRLFEYFAHLLID